MRQPYTESRIRRHVTRMRGGTYSLGGLLGGGALGLARFQIHQHCTPRATRDRGTVSDGVSCGEHQIVAV